LRSLFFCLFFVIFAGTSFAQNRAKPNHHLLSFQDWKSRQIIEAENRSARLGNHLKLAQMNGLSNPNEINKMEIDCRVAQNAAQVMRDLTIEDYFNVYLSQFLRQPGTIEEAAHSLTKNQVALLLKMYLASHETNDQASNL
jgi:hypothetical protein